MALPSRISSRISTGSLRRSLSRSVAVVALAAALAPLPSRPQGPTGAVPHGAPVAATSRAATPEPDGCGTRGTDGSHWTSAPGATAGDA